jgi:uncharacterized membrane protein YheB (UPF0754 family)
MIFDSLERPKTPLRNTDLPLEIPSWFYYVLAPVLGIIIGYVTNAIAIKMLFRPLQEKRIFGIRLPFTPGIIPRQRGKLATNVGRMVSEKLFTVETIRGHLNRPEIQQGLALNLAVSLTELTEKPLSEVFPFLFENEGREIQAMLTGSEFQKSFQGFLEPVADFSVEA